MVVVAVYQQEFYNPKISGIKISYPKKVKGLRTSPRNVQVILEMARYNPTSNFAC